MPFGFRGDRSDPIGLNGLVGQLEILATKTSLSARAGEFAVERAVDWGNAAIALDLLWSEIASEAVDRVTVRCDQPGVAALDASGLLVTEPLWADDERSVDDAAWCNKKRPPEWWIERMGEIPQARHGLTKLSWLHRSDLASWNRMSKICGVDDFVRWKLLDTALENVAVAADTIVALGFGSSTRPVADDGILRLLDESMNWDDVIPRVVPRGTILGSRDGVEIAT